MKNRTIVFSRNRDLVVGYGKKLQKRKVDIIEGPAGPTGNHAKYYYVIYASKNTSSKEITYEGLMARKLPEELVTVRFTAQEQFDLMIRFLNGEKINAIAESLDLRPQDINGLVFTVLCAIHDVLRDTKYWRGPIAHEYGSLGMQEMKRNKAWWRLYLRILFKNFKEEFEKAFCERNTPRLKTADSWDPKYYIRAHKQVEPINYTA